MRSSLARLASGAPVPVFPVVGAGARDRVRELRLHDELSFVDSPKAANVLLVAGGIPDSFSAAALAVHDAMSHPRATVRWALGHQARAIDAAFPEAVQAEAHPVEAIVRTQFELLSGRRRSEPATLPDVDPAPWRGVGPYGQGGSGMTGGVPYGRPLADRAPDRDGLTLDQLPVRVGPFFPALPPGLVLDVKLQGDVIQEIDIAPVTREAIVEDDVALEAPDAFVQAMDAPVAIASLELERSRSHLRWLSEALAVQGLGALARRTLRLATRLGPADLDDLQRLCRAVQRTGVLSWSVSGVGVIRAAELAGTGAGPVARAAGLSEDARSEDPAYRDLGFEPVVNEGGDAGARWRQRLAETVQSLELCRRAGDRVAAVGQVESPWGLLEAGSHPSARILDLVPRAVVGQEWGEAVTTIVSLDLHVDGIRSVTARRPQKAAR